MYYSPMKWLGMCVFVLMLCAVNAQSVDFYSVESIPEDAVIQLDGQFNDGSQYPNTTQARWLSQDQEPRGVAQVFTWHGDAAFTGIGFRIAKVQGSGQATFIRNQDFAFQLQAINEAEMTGQVFLDARGTMEPTDLRGGTFLFVRCSSSVPLQDGRQYVAHLFPLNTVGNNRIFVDTTKNNPYPEGWSRQTRGQAYDEDGSQRLASGNEDFGFFVAAGEGDSPMVRVEATYTPAGENTNAASVPVSAPEVVADLGKSVVPGLAPWVPIGNELETKTDSVTGRQVRYLTNGESMNYIFYPHCITWLNGSDYVFFESDRPRPEELGESVEGEKQILAADPQTGDLFWVCTIPKSFEGVIPPVFRLFHVDFAHESAEFAITDTTARKLFIHDLRTGQTRLIFEVPEGDIIGDPPSISADGTVLAQWVSETGKFERDNFYNGRQYSVYVLRKQADGSYESRRIIVADGLLNPRVALSHAVLNPLNPEILKFRSDGVRVIGANGMGSRLVLADPTSGFHTHQLWDPDGDSIFFVKDYQLAQIGLDGSPLKIIGLSENPEALHISVTTNGELIAYDTPGSGDWDAHDSRPVDIKLFERKTGKVTHLSTAVRGKHHPRHPHPQISPDEKFVAYTTADGPNGRVAVVAIP